MSDLKGKPVPDETLEPNTKPNVSDIYDCEMCCGRVATEEAYNRLSHTLLQVQGERDIKQTTIVTLHNLCQTHIGEKWEAIQRAEKAEGERDRIRQETIEEAAKVAEHLNGWFGLDLAMHIAKCIRALGEKPVSTLNEK